MAWGYSFVDDQNNAEKAVYTAIRLSRGNAVPSLKKEVREQKGIVEKVRRLASLTTSSDWNRIVEKGLCNVMNGAAWGLIPAIQDPNDQSVTKLQDYREFGETCARSRAADEAQGASYWILIEATFFRLEYQAPDLVEKAFRENPNLRTFVQIGTPIMMRFLKGAASFGMGMGGEAMGGVGANLMAGGDQLLGGLADLAIKRVERVNAPGAQHVGAPHAALRNNPGARETALAFFDLEDPHTASPLGLATLTLKHRALTFQITPVRMVTAGNRRTISAFHKSIIGVRSFAGGDGSAMRYLQFYDAAQKNPRDMLMLLAQKYSFDAWMDQPIFYVRDADPTQMSIVENLATSHGATHGAVNYQEWRQ